ncbi:MAG: CRISPR system precrRNA processing endoribonuclease RAMP protein Cas6 [Desulfuromusa sp.]
MSRIAQRPRPYIIQPPLETKCHYKKGDNFDFNLILLGETNEYLPYFIYAFESMGKTGLGKKIDGHRATYILESVELQGQTIYSSTDQQLADGEWGCNLQLSDPLPDQVDGKLLLTIKTPLRLKFDNHLQAKLPFSLLVRAMLRRISSLFETYGEGEPPLDYRGLVERAKKIEICHDNLQWFDWQRYSNRQEAKMLMGGMVGSITYQGKIGEYLPLLELCRDLHLGKQTAFGLGKIDSQWQPA